VYEGKSSRLVQASGAPHHQAGLRCVSKHQGGFWFSLRKEKKRKKNYANSKTAPRINQGKGATWEEKPLHQKKKKAVS